MSSVPALNTSSWLTQATSVQEGGSTQGSSSAMDAFAALFAQTLSLQGQAQSSGQAATQGSATGTQVSTSGQSSASTDLAALGQALSSNNMAAAQQAFQSLQTDLQGTQQTHHHHHHSQVSGSGQDSSAQTGTGTANQVTAISQAMDSSQGGTSTDSQMLGLLLGAN